MLFKGLFYGFIIMYVLTAFIFTGIKSCQYVVNCFKQSHSKELTNKPYKGDPAVTKWIVDYYLNLKD